MDQFDRAQELDARYRPQAMTIWQKGLDDHQTEPSRYCEECVEEIPEERRLAVPGCRRCRNCQQLWEQRNR